jgi:hypothetical protein
MEALKCGLREGRVGKRVVKFTYKSLGLLLATGCRLPLEME